MASPTLAPSSDLTMSTARQLDSSIIISFNDRSNSHRLTTLPVIIVTSYPYYRFFYCYLSFKLFYHIECCHTLVSYDAYHLYLGMLILT